MTVKRLKPAREQDPGVHALLEQEVRRQGLTAAIEGAKTIDDLKNVLLALIEGSPALAQAMARSAERRSK